MKVQLVKTSDYFKSKILIFPALISITVWCNKHYILHACRKSAKFDVTPNEQREVYNL